MQLTRRWDRCQHSELDPTKVSLDTLTARRPGQLRPKISAKYQFAATITTKPPTSVLAATVWAGKARLTLALRSKSRGV
jgi:hypothetical protein